MQQTQKYKLNLIERNDPFLPDALNQNTQKVEDVLKEKMEGPVEDLNQRVTVLEARKIFCGSVVNGTSIKSIHVPLGFQPKAVIASSSRSGAMTFVTTDAEGGDFPGLSLAEDGFDISYFPSSCIAFVAIC